VLGACIWFACVLAAFLAAAAYVAWYERGASRAAKVVDAVMGQLVAMILS